MGVSYALEGGADGVAVPWPDRESFQTILAMAAGLPVWIKPTKFEGVEAELGDALQMGATGLWLDQQLFAAPDISELLNNIGAQIHPAETDS